MIKLQITPKYALFAPDGGLSEAILTAEADLLPAAIAASEILSDEAAAGVSPDKSGRFEEKAIGGGLSKGCSKQVV